MTLLTCSGVTLKFPGQSTQIPALTDIDLQVDNGDHVALVGKPGAGKTTLLRVLAGHIRPTAGTVKLQGLPLALLGGPSTSLQPEISVWKNCKLLLLSGTHPRWRDNAFVQTVLLQAGLEEHTWAQPAKYLSRGTKTRLRLTVMAQLSGDILLIDEAISSVEGRFRDPGGLSDSAGIYSSHNLRQLSFCNRAVWLESGRIRMSDRTAVVFKAYRHSLDI